MWSVAIGPLQMTAVHLDILIQQDLGSPQNDQTDSISRKDRNVDLKTKKIVLGPHSLNS